MLKLIQNATRAYKAITAPLRREDGAVMMEAVIIMPLLAGFYCATLVWFDAYRQKNLVMKASYAVSDVLSRQDEADNDFIDNMRDMMDYMIPSNAKPRLRVSLIYHNINHDADNKYRLVWSYGPNGMTDLTQADLDKDQSWLPVMGEYEYVVVTETAVSYQPIFRVGIPDQIYRNTIVTRPRNYPRLDNPDQTDYSSNPDDVDNDGDGDQVGTETDPDSGGSSDQGDNHSGST